MTTHMCEQRRRWEDRHRPANRISYEIWLRYYQKIQPHGKKREYQDFIASAYYTAFVKFGTYCIDIGAVNPLGYSDWLFKQKTPLDSWTSDRIYGQYLVEYLKLEDGVTAVGRSIETLLKLAEQENINLTDVLRLISANKLCYLVSQGHISPWLLYHSDGGINFLGSLNSDQTNVVFEYINPEQWNIKFKRETGLVTEVKNLLKKIGL